MGLLRFGAKRLKDVTMGSLSSLGRIVVYKIRAESIKQKVRINKKTIVLIYSIFYLCCLAAVQVVWPF